MANAMVKIRNLKPGMVFLARIEGTLVEGKIQIQDGNLYLCQNARNGSSCRNKLGYKYSWVVRTTSEGYPRFANYSITNFTIPAIKPITEAFGYNIKRVKGKTKQQDKFVFGCGEVKVTRAELEAYNKIRSIAIERSLRTSSVDKTVNNLLIQ